MEGNQSPLSDSVSSIEQVNTQEEIFNKEEQKSQKKKDNSFLLIISILLVLIIAFGVYYFSTSKPDEEGNEENIPEQEEVVDVSGYTDIELENYDDFAVEVSEGNQEEDLVKGVVTFKKKTGERAYDYEYMRIVNKKVLTTEDELKNFEDIKKDIVDKNINAEWLTAGEPYLLWTSSVGTPVYNPLMIIKGVIYPNTDYTFSVLSLANGQEYAKADKESDNYQIFVYAIKGDNIIELKSLTRNLITDLGLSEEKSKECEKEIPNYWISYDAECLKEVFSTGEYDSVVKQQADELINDFKIK